MSKISPVNVFTPADEIRDVDRFAGRTPELQTLAHALESDGVQIVIYGNRGVGKSSLARQLEQMAQNNADIMNKLKIRPQNGFDYLTVFFRCDDTINSIPKLLLRLLTDEDALAPWVPFKVVSRQGSGEVGGGINVKVLSLSGKVGTSITEAAQELDTDIVSVFNNALQNISESKVTKDGVLLIIDEFDRIKDRTNLASLMKVLGPKRIKFALVGVSTNVQELILEHESVARQLSDGTILVPVMTREEMLEIFDKAEELLGNQYRFYDEARDWIINVAKGHPFYVHLIGKHSLLRAIQNDSHVVTQEVAEESLREIALKGSAPVQETAYKTAIGHSYIREHILKAFANRDEEEIHTSELYAATARQLNIDAGAISVYVGHLSSEKYGSALEKTRDRYYRFRDSLFKAYAAARPWQLRPGDTEET